MSDSLRPDLKDDGNKKVLGKFKDEMNSLIIKECTAVNPKVYSIIHEHFDKKTKQIVAVLVPWSSLSLIGILPESKLQQNKSSSKRLH